MAREDREESPGVDPEVARIRMKTVRGFLNIAEAVLEDPEVKRFARRIVLLEGLRMGIILAFLFTGLNCIFNAVKMALQNPIIDIIVGSILTLVAIILIVRDLRS